MIDAMEEAQEHADVLDRARYDGKRWTAVRKCGEPHLMSYVEGNTVGHWCPFGDSHRAAVVALRTKAKAEVEAVEGDDSSSDASPGGASSSGDASRDCIRVLDHGYVRLVDHMGGDLSVVRAARVSYDAAWRAGEDEGSDARLINYLWRNKHTTPFEVVTATFEVFIPIFAIRQWHRHRTQTYNELSARYRRLTEVFYLPDPALIGVQSKASKQARDIAPMDDADLAARFAEVQMVREHHEKTFALYGDLIAKGWPKELARTVLPVATYTHMFATMNLLNLFKFLSLRDHPHAQHEIRVYAEAMRELIRPVAPVCVAAWEENR